MSGMGQWPDPDEPGAEEWPAPTENNWPAPPSASASPGSPSPAGQPNSASLLANPWVAAGVAFGVSALVGAALWDVLAIPGNALTSLFESDDRNCSDHRTGTSGMYWCSARIGLWQVAGPILVAVLMVLVRRPLGAQLARLKPKIPTEGRFLLTPVLATTLFTMVFASVHTGTAGGSGYISQRLFPAVIGLLTHLMPAGGRLLSQRAPKFLAVRDRFPVPLRLVAALAIPLALSYFGTKGATADLKNSEVIEQRTILASAGLGWLALVPRDGQSLAKSMTSMGTRGLPGGTMRRRR